MKDEDKIQAVRSVLIMRGLQDKFNNTTNSMSRLNMLKQHDHNKNNFSPLTDYDSFK